MSDINDINEALTAYGQSDGGLRAAVRLLTGLTDEDIDALGGLPDVGAS